MKVVTSKDFTASMTVVELSDGSNILFSYETPVAAFIPGKGTLYTKQKWSVTTSKHISKFCAWIGIDKSEAKQEEQSFFNNLAKVEA